MASLLQADLESADHNAVVSVSAIPPVRDPEGMDLIWASRAFQRLMFLAQKVAATNAPVLLIGENGTGKELLASYLHRNSRRANEPLVRLSCPAMQEAWFEPEMFGHAGHAGIVQTAHRGTLFLDEITDLPMTLQARLLPLLQGGTLRAAGEENDEKLDIRFISASSVNPFDAIREKRLREDLYFELNVFTLRIPALRERSEDIPLLANYFFARAWRKHRPADGPMPSIGEETMAFLSTRRWRGNLRELENVVERLVLLAEPGSTILPSQIPTDDSPEALEAELDAGSQPAPETYHDAREQILAQFEKEYITRLVARTSGNISRAARIADVDRATLYRMIDRNGLRRDLRS